MKCYNHPESDGVAICRNCGRALCMNCAVGVSNRMACKDKCENEVKAMNELLTGGRTAVQNARYMSKTNMYSIISASFIGAGIISIIVSGHNEGVILLLIGMIFFAVTASHIRKKSSEKKEF